ncbi:hypothetical protein EVAR_56171_1 [Eumeta japonica]|uniref:Uncharacterized protein n=1 Tax=Eumeta variegata TaxID=151549 RepID=A0A4C1Y6F6_EUMVA|nr:hypothetical protein EVAR_56171_1 [Eumeta japonica]
MNNASGRGGRVTSPPRPPTAACHVYSSQSSRHKVDTFNETLGVRASVTGAGGGGAARAGPSYNMHGAFRGPPFQLFLSRLRLASKPVETSFRRAPLADRLCAAIILIELSDDIGRARTSPTPPAHTLFMPRSSRLRRAIGSYAHFSAVWWS